MLGRGEAGLRGAGWGLGAGGVGRCCQLCEILVRKQSEKDFCNLFKSRATFSIQAKAMSKAGKARCGGGKGGRGRFKGKAGGIFSYLQQ